VADISFAMMNQNPRYRRGAVRGFVKLGYIAASRRPRNDGVPKGLCYEFTSWGCAGSRNARREN